MQYPISITAISSISSLGSTPEEIWNNYKLKKHFFSKKTHHDHKVFVGALSENSLEKVDELRSQDLKYKRLDKSVLMAVLSARVAVSEAGWVSGDFGINIGSSRGATALFEEYHSYYIENGKAETLTSPTTTLGNISTWIAHDLQTSGPTISHSITCSTALHAVLNGVAWINSGMNEKFLVGGSEAPLTDFTIAQMQALKIYADNEEEFPCKALDFSKSRNTMILGEGAAVMCLEKGIKKNAKAIIESVGYATEILKHNISISDDAICFQKSMKMALKGINPADVDIIVMHAPGTIKGDSSEFNAIEKVFDELPALTTNKWKLGHTFGASGGLSLELAMLMIAKQEFIGTPFFKNKNTPKNIKKILVNAVGFGGNAVSILVSKPN